MPPMHGTLGLSLKAMLVMQLKGVINTEEFKRYTSSSSIDLHGKLSIWL